MNKVESKQGRHLTLTSDLYTYTYVYKWVQMHLCTYEHQHTCGRTYTHHTHMQKNKNWVQTHPDLKSVSVFGPVVVSLHSTDLGVASLLRALDAPYKGRQLNRATGRGRTVTSHGARPNPALEHWFFHPLIW